MESYQSAYMLGSNWGPESDAKGILQEINEACVNARASRGVNRAYGSLNSRYTN